MSKLIIFHGTSRSNAEKILREGFKVDGVKNNWNIHSKDGFVYFSSAYALFYAMRCDTDDNVEGELALIKVEIDEDDLYPEDDFIMYANGKPKYTQEELDAIDFELWKPRWCASLKYLGNVCAKPDKVKILGVTYFFGRKLQLFCDPSITPINFKILGKYYNDMTEYIFSGKDIMDFKTQNDFFKEQMVKS